MADDWQPIRSAPEGIKVDTKIDDAQGVRNQQRMTRRGNRWFVDGGTYVYYCPMHWRHVAGVVTGSGKEAVTGTRVATGTNRSSF